MKTKNKKRNLLTITLLTTAILLSGCKGSKPNVIETNEGTFIQTNNGDYEKLNYDPVEFEVGKHIVHYIINYKNYLRESYLPEGGVNNILETPEIPDGYELISHSFVPKNGYVYTEVYTFVNNKKVVVIPNYNTLTNKMDYENFGTVVEDEMKLGLGD